MRTAAAFTLLLFGCYHLDIAPLPATPSPEQRLSTWQALHATHEVTITTCSNRGGCSESNLVRLANGDETGYPADLLPVVGPDSPTAQHARRAAHHQSIMGVLTGVGIVLLAGTAVALSADIGRDPDQPESAAQKYAIAAGLGSFLVVAAFDWYHVAAARHESRAAFASYNKDLGEFLRICAFRNMPIPCEQVSPGGAPGEYLPPTAQRATHPSLSMR